MKFLPGITLLLVSLLFSAQQSFAQQDYYWVGGSGNWSDVSHWATTSGGTTFHETAPTLEDDVYFNAQSFTGSGQTITIDVAAQCHDFDWTGTTNFPALNSDFQLDIYGSVVLNTDVQYNLTDVYFKSGDMGETITTNGASFGSSSVLRFDGSGGWAMAGNLDVKTLYLIKGTFATNDYNITVSGIFHISGTTGNLLDVDLGSSMINCQTLRNSSASDLVLDAGTSEISTVSFIGDMNGNGPFTYYDIIFENGGLLYESNNFNSVKLSAGLLRIESGTIQTMNDFIADGNKYSTLEIKGLTEGSEATINISSGIVNIDFVYLRDLHASGASSFSATNSIDNGNTNGWSISGPVSKDYYWIGDGGEWDDPAHWATASGGSATHGDYPSKFDNVYFDANSFTVSGQTVDVDIPDADSKNMDWTGVTNNPTFYSPYASNVNFYGDVIFSMNMTKNIYHGRVYGEQAGLEFHYGGGNIQNFTFMGSGEYSLYDPVNCGNFYVFEGTVNMGEITANVDFTYLLSTSNVTVNMGSAIINTRDFDASASSAVIDPGTSIINMTRDFIGNGYSFNEVVLNGSGTVSGSNTFQTLTLSPGVTVTLEGGSTQTVTNLNLVGAKASPININSTNPGTQTTFSVASGIVDGIYLIMQDIEATGGATFNATQTIDNGNNTGWNITGVVAQDYYWVGGSGNWSDYENHWATSSGGSTFHLGEPGVLDNVFFDANSFSSAQEEVAIDLNTISMHDLDMSAMDDSASITGYKILNIYGSTHISEIAGFEVSEVHFLSAETETIVAKNDHLANGSIYIDGSGTFTLLDSLLIQELFINGGTFDTDGNYVHISFRTTLDGSSGILLDLGTSAFFTRSFTNGNASNYTINASEATIIFSSTFTPDFSNENNVMLNDLVIRQVNSTDDGNINSNITVNTLTVEDGSPITVRSGSTVTANQINMIGTVEKPILLSSSIEGNPGTLSQATGTVDAQYLQIKDNIATGGAVFNAYSSVNLGNASGWTFFKSEQTISFPAIEDKNFDDLPFDLEATATSGLDIVYEIISGPASVEGNLLTLDGSIGTVEVKASQPGDINYFPAQSVINTFEVTGFAQEITFPDIDDLVYGDAPVFAEAFSTVGVEVEFSSSNPEVGEVVNNQFVIAGVGQTTITAFQPGNDSTSAAEPVQVMVTVSKAPLTITADDITINYGEDIPSLTFTIAGLVYDETEDDLLTPVEINATGTNAGTYAIEVGGATSNNYEITFVNGLLTIEKIDQEITLDVPPEVDISTGSLTLEPEINTGLDISLELISGPATLDGTTLTFTGTGEIVVTASQAGGINHHPAENVQVVILVTDGSKTDQTITFGEIQEKRYGDEFEITASTTSGLPVTFTVTRGSAEITGNMVKIVGIGSISIRASQIGNDTFNPGTAVTRNFNAVKAPLTITAEDKEKVYGEVNPELTMVFDGFVNGEDEGVITMPTIETTAQTDSDAGTYPITVSGGSAVFYDLTLEDGTLTVNKAEAIITITDLEQEADGNIKSPTITTDPENLIVVVTYNGSSNLPLNPGEYEVVVTVNNINYQGELTTTFILTTDAEVLSASSSSPGIKVFPNPTAGFLSFEGISKGKFTLIDFMGKVLMISEISPEVNLPGLADGQYLLILHNAADDTIGHLRLVIKN